VVESKAFAGDTFRFGAIVLLIGSIVRIGASIYLPALPVIGRELQVSDAMMSHTLTLYFVVFALFTLVAGVLSDAYGRKVILTAGMLFFIAGSTICALTQSFEMLLIGRGVQAFGASMIPGTLLAMIRDACADARVVTLVGWLAVLSGLFLVAAPLIGGVLTYFLGWQSNFWFLVIFTLLVFLAAIACVEETLPKSDRIRLGEHQTVTVAYGILFSADFVLVLLPVILCFAIQGAFLAAAPYIIVNGYGLTPVEFGISNIVIVIGIFAGRAIGARLLKHRCAAEVYRTGGLSVLVVGILFGLLGVGMLNGLVMFLLLMSLFATVFGMLSPIGMKSSLTVFRSTSGITASLQGASLLGASAIGSSMVGLGASLSPDRSIQSVFALVAALFCCGTAIASLASRHRLV